MEKNYQKFKLRIKLSKEAGIMPVSLCDDIDWAIKELKRLYQVEAQAMINEGKKEESDDQIVILKNSVLLHTMGKGIKLEPSPYGFIIKAQSNEQKGEN